MPIYKPENTPFWYVDIIDPGGKRIRRSTGTAVEREAQEFHDRLKADLWRTAKLGEKQPRTFDEAALRWIREKGHKKSIDKDIEKIGRLRKFFDKLKLHEITADHCRKAVDLAAPDVEDSTKNRYLALLRGMLNRADKEWLWIDKAPHISLYSEPEHRIRWITPTEAQRLIDNLPRHLVPIVRVALATGLRKLNVYLLRWDQIDMQRHVAWIHPDQAKAKRAIGVPLNRTAIEAIRSQLGKHREYVFTYRGKPLKGGGNEGFDEACRKAQIEDFCFHDLRHTWASWMIQAGTGLEELRVLGGWESIEMVMRYAHLAPDHLHKYSQKIDALMTDFCHSAESSKKETGNTAVLTR
jgi:integrase